MRTVRFMLAAMALPLTAATLAAQSYPTEVQRALDNCLDQRSSDRERVCEVRTVPVARGTRALDIDGGANGGIRVTGWDRDSIAVYAVVQAQAEERSDAEALAREIRIASRDGRIRTEDEPAVRGRNRDYGVSYHVYAPRRIDVTAETTNGGISVDDIAGRIDVEAVNGGVAIRRAGGDVRGRTTNGGITLALAGTRWEGRGVELETTNGGVTLTIPEHFNARLEASTVNGGFNIDFPIQVQGRIGRRLTTTLGSGGPLVRVQTTNGGVRIRRG